MTVQRIIIAWLDDVSLDEVNTRLAKYREEREERRRFHRGKIMVASDGDFLRLLKMLSTRFAIMVEIVVGVMVVISDGQICSPVSD